MSGEGDRSENYDNYGSRNQAGDYGSRLSEGGGYGGDDENQKESYKRGGDYDSPTQESGLGGGYDDQQDSVKGG
ncbi:hypothetical protein ABE54_00930, partial [Bacillus thuringiensis]|nr:hypothetical protein [Bacillus thuringiensis]